MSWKDKYDHVGNFSEGLVRVELKGKLGYVDKTGKVVKGRKDLIIGVFKWKNI